MNNIFYICQTLVEDGRMDEKTFQKRVIKFSLYFYNFSLPISEKSKHI